MLDPNIYTESILFSDYFFSRKVKEKCSCCISGEDMHGAT